MLLAAATPADWTAIHFARFFRSHFEAIDQGAVHTRLSLAALLADDAAELRRIHARLLAEGSPSTAAVTYLSGWFGGILGAGLGYAAAAAGGSGYLVEADQLSWSMHPDGWTDRAEIGTVHVVVPAGHAWAGQPGVSTVDDDALRGAMVVAALTEAIAPLTAALAKLGPAKPVNLWHEVGDGISSALVYQHAVPVTPSAFAAVRALCEVPAAPWRRKPYIERIETWHGAICVMHKAGCCLAYTETHDEDDDHHHEDDEDHALFHRLFPDTPGAPHYCSNCRLKPRDECFTHQKWWREREYLGRQKLTAAG